MTTNSWSRCGWHRIHVGGTLPSYLAFGQSMDRLPFPALLLLYLKPPQDWVLMGSGLGTALSHS